MLTIVLGPNGSGKSLYAMRTILDLLRHDSRPIITSLAVDVGRVNEYLQDRYGDKSPSVCDRLYRIDGSQMRNFWRYRGIELRFEAGEGTVAGEWRMGLVEFGPFGQDLRWQKVPSGVIYVLDEAQTVFGAREWTKTGNEFVSYQSQHRKFGDDVIAISPASALLEKQFRILAGECVGLSNLYNLKIGWVKAPRKIVGKVYQNCPPGPGEPEIASLTLHIDPKGLASCYDTAAGVGIAGAAGADKGKESKGIPVMWLFPALALAALCVWFGMRTLLHAGVERGVKKLSIGGSVPVYSPPGGETASASVPVPALRESEVKKGGGVVTNVLGEKVWLQGLGGVGGKVWAFLSDGRVLRSENGSLRSWGRDWVSDGENRFVYQPASDRDRSIQRNVRF